MVVVFTYSESIGLPNEKFRFRAIVFDQEVNQRSFSKTVQVEDNRPIVKIPNFENGYVMVHTEYGYKAYNYKLATFIVTDEIEHYPGSSQYGLVTIKNDPFQSIDPSIADGQTAIEAVKRYVGNVRCGYSRILEHIGGTVNLPDTDLFATQTNLTEIPFFPPPPSNYDQPDRVKIVTTDTGYKHYIVSPHPLSGTKSALETKELTGKKTIVWDNTHAEFLAKEDISSVSADDKQALKVQGIEAVLDAALSAIHANLGTFKAEEGVWEQINIPGQCKIRSDSTAVVIEIYEADWSAVAAFIKIDVATGLVTFQSGADTSIALAKDGDITVTSKGKTIVNSTGNVEINGTVKIVGSLDVS